MIGKEAEARPVSRALLATVALTTIALDQWTKQLARESLQSAPPIRLLRGVLTLLYAENSGAFLSLGASLPQPIRTAIFTAVVTLALAAAAYLLAAGRVPLRSDAFAYALLVGGGVGNVTDRFVHEGRVTDFLYLSLGPLHTGVFNIADLAITAAVCWLLITSLKGRDRGREAAEQK